MQPVRSLHKISKPTLLDLEKRWDYMSPDEKMDIQRQLNERQRGPWSDLTMEEKKAAYFIAFGPYGSRSILHPPGFFKKVALGTLGMLAVSGIVFYCIRLLANPPPSTMTKEWQEASNELIKSQNIEPITGISSEGYIGKGMVRPFLKKKTICNIKDEKIHDELHPFKKKKTYDELSVNKENVSIPKNGESMFSKEDSILETSQNKIEERNKNVEARLKDEKNDSWSTGQPVPYSFLCKTFDKIENTTKRLDIFSYTTDFLFLVLTKSPENLLQSIYLMINKVSSDYDGLELGIGESLLIKAIGESTGRSIAKIKQDYKEYGDLGLVAMNSRINQPTMFKGSMLTIPGVFKSLKEIATISGKDSQVKKLGIIKKLLSVANGNETKYIVRSLEGKLRIRLAEKTVIVSLAHTMVRIDAEKSGSIVTPSSLANGENIIKQVFSQIPSYDIIVSALLKYGIQSLSENCKLTPGIPLKPMLAKPTKTISEVLDRFENQHFTCEYKYDGERTQIHLLDNGKIKIFSRNLEDISNKYPDIIEVIPKVVIKEGVTSFVLDCESVAWDREKKIIQPFQILSTRKKKEVDIESIKVKICIFAFDLLYMNGESLIHKSFRERRNLLTQSFKFLEGEFSFVQYSDLESLEDIQTFLEKSVQDSCEGLMVKMLDGEESGYEPSKRSRNWLKIKKDYMSNIGDSLDLVVLGGFYGRGKRANMYGAYLLGCYEPNKGVYESICKLGTGFSDEILESYTTFFNNHILEHKKPYYHHSTKGEQPDLWFEPVAVWEVLAADLSISPKYLAAVGMVDSDKGLSLRFPRYIRARDDKTPEQATTSEQVAEMYEAQLFRQKNTSYEENEELDY
ncbi:hypothetical protein PORY_001745 [Pneumocystis oryctolagi]|uniref:Uncharacterized protein n=1 Tax=Pneumocystis oryctolagi TaxID=42067 RepID=A0ACB7CDX3_9ASCO|nr:hypothetical protein PORY_001745 [Pneumocystis oryctolagi]